MEILIMQWVNLIIDVIIAPWIVEIAAIVKVVAFPGAILSSVPILVWIERRGSAFIQDRKGPNRAQIFGFTLFGGLHLIADTIKFFFKEVITPAGANVFYYFLAPIIVVITSILAFAVIPISSPITMFGKTIYLQIAHIDGGILYIFAISSVGVIGVAMAGWASNNKYTLMGGIRATAQMISYEIPMGLALLGAVLAFGTLNPMEMVQYQEGLIFGFIPRWGILIQPLGFILLLVAGFAETNRLPFDLPEGEHDLVAGYHTEYGSMKFSMFMMAEYVAMVTISSLLATLYLGGYTLPWLNSALLIHYLGDWPAMVIHLGVFTVKVAFFLWLFIWVRWTLPSFRYDQVMDLGWKRLIPIGLINIVITALLVLIPGLL
jgi:NADH-quinone oxidoreductase subunit H